MKVRSPKSEVRRRSGVRRPKLEGRKRAGKHFGFRASDFEFRIWLGALPLLAARLAFGAGTNSPGADDIPPLRPPHGEIPPSFWEQYGVWVVLGGVVVLALATVGVWLLTRSKPPAVTSPEEQARRAIEPLRQKAEDGALLSEVSQILRHYVMAAFGLPPEELTTAEFCRAIGGQDKIGPDLSTALGEFLRQCDERKFAPAAPGPPLGAAARALKLIEQVQVRRASLAQSAAQSAQTPVTVPLKPAVER